MGSGFEIRSQTMLGMHGLFAGFLLLAGWIGLRSGSALFLFIFLGGLWFLILFLIDLAKIWVRHSGVEPVVAVITNISRRGTSISSEDTGESDYVLIVTCKSEDGRIFKEKTLQHLNNSNLGGMVPVYVSGIWTSLYMVDLSNVLPSDGKTPDAAAVAEETAPSKETPDQPPANRPRGEWRFDSQDILMILIALPFLAFGLFFVIVGGIELWPFLIFSLVGAIILIFEIRRIVRRVQTFEQGECVDAVIESVTKQEEGPYTVILRGEDRSYTIKKNFVGNVQIGSHVPVYVSRRDPDVYEADL